LSHVSSSDSQKLLYSYPVITTIIVQ